MNPLASIFSPQIAPLREDLPPIDTKFKLGETITEAQQDFLNHYGFLHFEGVASPEEVEMLRSEQKRLQDRWLSERKKALYGIPLFFGEDENGKRMVQRMPYTTMFSERIRAFVRDRRFEPIKSLVGDEVRVGDDERDGAVMNQYVNVPGSTYPRLGWHTDGLRDIFYLRMPQQKLNFGIHLDRIQEEDGGLRLLPGTHKQSYLQTCFYKPYFLSHKAHQQEITVTTKPGDITVHDGRLWHRVERSKKTGAASLRRTLYVPYMSGPKDVRSEESSMPIYHRFFGVVRKYRKQV